MSRWIGSTSIKKRPGKPDRIVGTIVRDNREFRYCFHSHKTFRTARTCAEGWAKQLNKEETNEES